MSDVKSGFLREMFARGYVHQCSDLEALDARLTSETSTSYVGYDCTAPSLHVGNLVSIMMLHWFQVHGHRPITLMGGGTTRVGDPSGKDDTRQLRTGEEIDSNKASIKKTFANFLTFGDGPKDALMADNADWLLDLNYVDFLRDVGRHFSVNRMLTFDSVKLRLDREQPLSFLEFNYMILQAYDFVELNRRYACGLQMGGSDQWGNIINGIELGRRMDGADMFALTTPLITTASGAKMGKTADGAVWLNADQRSPYEYWQFWRNTEDADVEKFLKLFTILPLDEIARLGALQGAELNDAKKTLATEATAILHGRNAAQEAAETARKTFEEGALGDSLPTVVVSQVDLKAGLGVLAAAVLSGLAGSNGEARRHIKGGALKVNDKGVGDERAVLGQADVTDDGVIKMSVGKKRHALLRVE